jgi:hypothetical protein
LSIFAQSLQAPELAVAAVRDRRTIARLDPEKVYQAYASGQSFEELQPSIRAGKFLPDSIPNIGLPISVNTEPSAVRRAAD